MKYDQLIKAIRKASKDRNAPLPSTEVASDAGELLDSINALISENRSLQCKNNKANSYIRTKTNQLLDVIGTIPLKPEELEDDTLITMDPIGVVAESFIQVLDHQRETNKKLELTMEEIKAIFDAVGCSVLVVDENMHVQAYNDLALQLFPEFEGEWKGTPCHEIVCRDSRLHQQCPFRKVLDTGQAVHFPDWQVRDRFYDIVATPVKNNEGKVVYGVLLYHDITFQKQAATAIAAEKEQLAITLRSIAEGVITTDVDGNIVLMNRVAEYLTAWP
ncbi:MAG: PAS domain-containing protein, partial [Desulfobulbaceae bacterium]|nr:PAS domain-containing protein [Desulfobulbaceae bacterium]